MLCTLAVAEYVFALLRPASPAHMCLQRSPLSLQPCGHSHRSNKCRGWGSRDGACALSTLRGDRHRRKTSQSGIDRLDRHFRHGIAFQRAHCTGSTLPGSLSYTTKLNERHRWPTSGTGIPNAITYSTEMAGYWTEDNRQCPHFKSTTPSCVGSHLV